MHYLHCENPQSQLLERFACTRNARNIHSPALYPQAYLQTTLLLHRPASPYSVILWPIFKKKKKDVQSEAGMERSIIKRGAKLWLY